MKLSNKLTKREKRLLILAIVIIGGFYLYRLAISPAIESYQQLEQEIEAKQYDLKEMEMLINATPRYQKEVNDIKNNIEKMQEGFFNSSKEQARLKLLNLLDKEAKATNLVIQSRDLQLEEVEGTSLEKIICNLSLQGEIAELVEFLAELNQKNKLLRTEELELRRIEGEDELLINLNLIAINRKQEGVD